MRLLVNATSYGPVPGGAGLRARHLCEALEGHELVFLLARDTSPEVVPPGAETRVLPVRAGDPLRRWLRLRLPSDGDVLLTDHYPAADIPTIITLHDRGGSPWRRRLIRRHSQRAAGVVAVSETVRAAWGLRGIDAAVVPNGVTPVASFPEPGEHLLVSDPGLAHKGADVARRVAERLGLTLRKVGRGVAWLPHDRFRDELARARVVLCPAREEGFGMVPLEALAAGRPVVASDLPAHREVCGAAALYAPVDDIDAWCARVREALRDEGQWGARGRDQAARWTWSAAAARLGAALEAALDADQRAGPKDVLDQPLTSL
jgi:glycosyltransferase involved in cell wall biosynthesis